MKKESIQNCQLLEFWEKVSSLTEIQLETLGLNRSIRDRFLRDLVLPTTDTEMTPDECWSWTGSRNAERERGLICSAQSKTLNYRFVAAIVLERHINSLGFICHRCANPICSNPRHFYEGNSRSNAHDAMMDGTLARGITSPRALFKEAKTIQIIRSTGDNHKGTDGLISALARKYNAPWLTIQAIIARTSYKDVPEADEPEKLCVPLEELEIKPEGQRGDAHGDTRLPTHAAIQYYRLFHCLKTRANRNALLEFMMQRYDLQKSSLQDIVYGRARGGSTEFLRKKPQGKFAIAKCDPLFFEEFFRNYPPLRRKVDKNYRRRTTDPADPLN